MSVLQCLDDWLIWRIVSAVDPRDWQLLSTTCRSVCNFVLAFLRGLHILDLSSIGNVNLKRLVRACPNLEELCLNTLLIRSQSLTYVSSLSKLQELQLRECPLLTDAALHSIFSGLELQVLDVSWAAEFSDAPWGHAPASLREFRGVGCEHLTERVVVHLSKRCPHLTVLHSSRHINWIGAARPELLASLVDMQNLQDVAFQDIPLNDDLLYTLACLPSLSRLELWSYNSDQYITDAGVICLAEQLRKSLTKLSLDSFVFHGTGVLSALSGCSLQELLLEGTSQCHMGCINNVKLAASLIKLWLANCGLAGVMDLSGAAALEYLWLFDNPGLQGVQGAGQQLKTLNLGCTGCRSIEGFRFDGLDLLDVSSTLMSERVFEAVLLAAPLITRAVLGSNLLPLPLLMAFLQQATHLRNLSLVGAEGSGLATLASFLWETRSNSSGVASRLELLEISEDSCAMLAEWLSMELDHMVLKRSSKDIRIWIIEQHEHSSPYGRIDGADVSCMASLYRHGGDFCNLHFDEYSVADGKIDFSFGFTFGEDRQLVFEHREGHKVQFALPQRNGDVHAFGEGTNGRWRHGVPPSLECNGASISINVWGSRGHEEFDMPVSLRGRFPRIQFQDPAAASHPRECEACHRMAELQGGLKDLDGRWSCRSCQGQGDLALGLSWRPASAKSPKEATDCLTVKGAQLALAILAGRRNYLFRRAKFPDGWYALHVAREYPDPESSETLQLQGEWPSAPAEEDLPHEAFVGLLYVRAEGFAAKSVDWKGTFRKYYVAKTVALQDPLPARSPGIPEEPWRLSPIARREVSELIGKIYENAHAESSWTHEPSWWSKWSAWEWGDSWDWHDRAWSDWAEDWGSWRWSRDSWQAWAPSQDAVEWSAGIAEGGLQDLAAMPAETLLPESSEPDEAPHEDAEVHGEADAVEECSSDHGGLALPPKDSWSSGSDAEWER
ncbi:PRDX5, partial [Symbiodinium sp. KB8]